MALIKVGMADYKVGRDPDILINNTLGYGSCIGVSIYDPVYKVGGLLHIALPDNFIEVRSSDNPANTANKLLPLMINDVAALGASTELYARKTYGFSLTPYKMLPEIQRVHDATLDVCKQILRKNGVKVIDADYGGVLNRIESLDLANGVYKVKTSERGEISLLRAIADYRYL